MLISKKKKLTFIILLALLTSTISVNAAPVPRESAACNAISDKFSSSTTETYKLIVGGNDITAYVGGLSLQNSIDELATKMSFEVEKYKIIFEGEEQDELFDSEEAAEEYALYLCSCAEEGAEILHLSNPGDYDYDEDNSQFPEYEIAEVDD